MSLFSSPFLLVCLHIHSKLFIGKWVKNYYCEGYNIAACGNKTYDIHQVIYKLLSRRHARFKSEYLPVTIPLKRRIPLPYKVTESCLKCGICVPGCPEDAIIPGEKIVEEDGLMLCGSNHENRCLSK